MSVTASRLAGSQVDKYLVDFENIKLTSGLTIWIFTSFNMVAILLYDRQEGLISLGFINTFNSY